MSLASPTTRCVWYQAPGHSLSSNNEVSERFAGASLRIVVVIPRSNNVLGVRLSPT